MTAVKQVTTTSPQQRTNLITRIVRDSGTRLLRFIRSRVSTDADAEDILQDVWQKCLTTLEDGPVEQLTAWLYTVARHRIIDRYRKRKTLSLDAPSSDSNADEDSLNLADLLPADDSEESESDRTLFWLDLHAALAQLPEPQRQVFIQHELEGLSYEQIAKNTGEKINTLLSRKRYALHALRKHLAAWHETQTP